MALPIYPMPGRCINNRRGGGDESTDQPTALFSHPYEMDETRSTVDLTIHESSTHRIE